ncbi:VOC family protein [Bacillus sp. JJ1609]|uniref:VOC family protein n=1 Tax=Bacillus sp. JJ1609 TaxID=3122977 RepID=UPI002FFD92BA
MNKQLLRVGTIYVPVTDVIRASAWYEKMLDAELSYQDEDKAILNMANMSFFLIKSKDQTSNFIDIHGYERFVLTFEVNGIDALVTLHHNFLEKGVKVSEIEYRGHTGRNFVFYDLDNNKFDVWSVLSQEFKKRYML